MNYCPNKKQRNKQISPRYTAMQTDAELRDVVSPAHPGGGPCAAPQGSRTWCRRTSLLTGSKGFSSPCLLPHNERAQSFIQFLTNRLLIDSRLQGLRCSWRSADRLTMWPWPGQYHSALQKFSLQREGKKQSAKHLPHWNIMRQNEHILFKVRAEFWGMKMPGRVRYVFLSAA